MAVGVTESHGVVFFVFSLKGRNIERKLYYE